MMDSNLFTMICALGGTALVAMALLGAIGVKAEPASVRSRLVEFSLQITMMASNWLSVARMASRLKSKSASEIILCP